MPTWLKVVILIFAFLVFTALAMALFSPWWVEVVGQWVENQYGSDYFKGYGELFFVGIGGAIAIPIAVGFAGAYLLDRCAIHVDAD